MAKGIEIGIASETKAFKQGIETGLIDPIEDAVDALDDLGKSKGPDKLEDALEDAQDASKKLEREVKDTADTIEDEFRKSYAKMKQTSGDGTSAAKRDLEELGNEARQNAAETFSSFDGSAESFADGIQGTLGGIVSSLGPIGAAAGAAGALSVGLISAAITQAGEDAEELEERIVELFDQMLESQSKYLAQEFINDNIRKVMDDTEQLADANRIAADSGVELSIVLRAMAGDQEALSIVQGKVSDQMSTVTEKIEAQKDATGRASEETLKQRDALQKIRDEFEKQTGTYSEAGRRYDLYTKATNDSAFANDQALRSVDNLSDGVGRLGSGLRSVPSSVNPKVTVDVDDRKLQSLLNKSYKITVRGDYLDRQGRRMLI